MISAGSIEALRLAIEERLATPDDALDRDTALRRALRTMSLEAHVLGVKPERLVVLIKEVWQTLSVTRSVRTRREQLAILERLITMCLDEYFEDA